MHCIPHQPPLSPYSPTILTLCVSAGHSSPARFKLGHTSSGGRKLGGTRTSPQLGPTTLPVLNQIHEEREAEEGGGSPCEDRRQHLGAPAGAAVLRRLEQRRRLHKVRQELGRSLIISHYFSQTTMKGALQQKVEAEAKDSEFHSSFVRF